MMGRALLVLGWIATVGLAATAVLGYQLTIDTGGLGVHLLAGLISSLLLLFSHCWIMFYLIGTGKAIKTAVADHELDLDFTEKTKEFKNRSYPALMFAMGAVMATFIIGGGVATLVVPPWIHAALFFTALVVQVRALLIEGSVLTANEHVMAKVGSLANSDPNP